MVILVKLLWKWTALRTINEASTYASLVCELGNDLNIKTLTYDTNMTEKLRQLCRKEFVRYFFVSLTALAIDLAFFSFLLRVAGLPWVYAATLSYFIGAAAAYMLSVRFVFSSRRLAHSPRIEFLSFISVGIVGLGVTQLVLWVGIGLLAANPELSKLAAACISFLSNYLVRKSLLFCRPSVA